MNKSQIWGLSWMLKGHHPVKFEISLQYFYHGCFQKAEENARKYPNINNCQYCDTLVCEFSFLFYSVRGCTNACSVITLVYKLCGKWGGFLNLINFRYSKFSSLSKAFIPNRSLLYGLYSPNARMILALFNVTSNSTNPIIVHKVFIEV